MEMEYPRCGQRVVHPHRHLVHTKIRAQVVGAVYLGLASCTALKRQVAHGAFRCYVFVFCRGSFCWEGISRWELVCMSEYRVRYFMNVMTLYDLL